MKFLENNNNICQGFKYLLDYNINCIFVSVLKLNNILNNKFLVNNYKIIIIIFIKFFLFLYI